MGDADWDKVQEGSIRVDIRVTVAAAIGRRGLEPDAVGCGYPSRLTSRGGGPLRSPVRMQHWLGGGADT